MNSIKKRQPFLWFSSIILSGCATPIVPLAGPEGNSVIFYLLLLIVIYLVWYIYKNITNTKIDSTDNNLDSRVTKIEEEIKILQSELKGKSHD